MFRRKLKTCAGFPSVGLTNSPATREIWWPFNLGGNIVAITVFRKQYRKFWIAGIIVFSVLYLLCPEPNDSPPMKRPRIDTNNIAVRQAAITDLLISPFSGWFEHIKPQITALAKCDAAASIAGDGFDEPMKKVEERLRNNLLSVLPAAEEDAKLYDLQIEYNRQWWATRGFILGMAQGSNEDVKVVASELVKGCITENQ